MYTLFNPTKLLLLSALL